MTLQRKIGVLTLLALSAGLVHAQMYKWKDAKGVTHFTDTPPPAAAGKVESKSYGSAAADSAPEDSSLPFALRAAVKNFPVTLYTGKQCAACEQGRSMLQARGIPFSEKTVTSVADQAVLKEAGGANQLPFLLIGHNKLTGFEQGAWDNALTAASYPAQRMLPANYPTSRAMAASARPPAPEANPGTRANAAAAEDALRDKNAPVNAPPGFQF